MVTESQPGRVSLTHDEYVKLSGFEVSCRNMEEILDDACGFGELPIDALKRVVAERDKFKLERERLIRDLTAIGKTIAKLRNDAEECTKIIVEHEQTIAGLNAELEKIRAVSGASGLQSTANAVKELYEWCRYVERAHSRTSRNLSVDRDSAIAQVGKLEQERDELKSKLGLAEFNADQYRQVLIDTQTERDRLTVERDELKAELDRQPDTEAAELFREAKAQLEQLTPEMIVAAMRTWTDEQRMDVLREFCRHCGDKDPYCQCWNDE